MAVCKARRALVQKIRAIAKRYGVPVVPDTAGRARVEAMRDQTLGCPGLTLADRATVEDAFDEYTQATRPLAQVDKRHVWKFKAAQLTYNATVGDWALTDMVVLESLFGRLVDLFKSLVASVHIIGLTVTLEEPRESGEHVHAHVYIHMEKPYRRKGVPADFVFEGIKPRVDPNTATGTAFMGAVKHGHFYVFVNKKGSLFSWANFEPFKEYAR